MAAVAALSQREAHYLLSDSTGHLELTHELHILLLVRLIYHNVSTVGFELSRLRHTQLLDLWTTGEEINACVPDTRDESVTNMLWPSPSINQTPLIMFAS